MKTLPSLLSLLLVVIANAQDSVAIAHTGLQFYTDDQVVVFADQCNLRSAPQNTAPVITKLFIGTEVKVVEVLETTLTLNGITAPWVKITSSGKTGYVWKPNLTSAFHRLPDNEMVLAGITYKQQGEAKEKTFSSIRVVEDYKIKYLKEFEVVHADVPDEAWLKLLPRPLLDRVKCVFIFETASEACGVYASEHHVLYTDSGLFFVGSGWGMGDGGVLHSGKSYYYPFPESSNNSYSKYSVSHNTIERVVENGEYDEECAYVTVSRLTRFSWDGFKLTKNCED